MKYNIQKEIERLQKEIERLQKYQKKHPDIKYVGEDEFLLLCGNKVTVNRIDDIIRRLKNMIETTSIGQDDYEKFKIDKYPSFYLTVSELADTKIIARKTIYDWINKGIINVTKFEETQYYTNATLHPDTKYIDLRDMLQSLELIQEKMKKSQ